MNKCIHFILAVLLLTAIVSAGEHKDGSKDRLAKTTVIQYDFISINTILMYLSNNGDMALNNTTNAAGLEWPQGSGKNAIFEDGIIWGGFVAGELRVGGSAYRHGLQPGPLDESGNPANPQDPKYHIFKVRRITATTFTAMTVSEQERLKKDYMEWPADTKPPYDKYAPFTNRDGVAGYQPDFDKWLAEQAEPDLKKHVVDEPFFIGDEVIYYVSNDMDPAITTYLYGTKPIGIEIQVLLWGYQSTGPLGNMIFTKYSFVNRGTDDLVDAYVSKWSDPDLGDANDDYVGIDTTLSLGYVYNGIARDAVYGIPPAAGYDFFQGPIVPGAPTDTAVYNFGKKGGYKNLQVSSFAFYINGSQIYRDPAQGTAAGGIEMYNYQKGLVWNGNPFVDPTTGLDTKFCLAGDPITKKGWVDGILNRPDDRRFLMTAGPFTLKKNERQEVVVATIIGRGSDRLSSIQVLKYYDKFAQIAFANNFDLPKAPAAPNLKYSVEANKIVLEWGTQANAVATENWNDRSWKFEGYNVYQLRAPSDPLSSAKRLVTYDVVDNIATIFDEVIDPNSGAVVTLPVQFGTDSGIERQYEITIDEITGRPLVNNQPYFYAVTAYSYNPAEDAVPHVLESTPKVIEIRPQFPNPGWRNTVKMQIDSTIKVTRLGGTSAGVPKVMVVDPMKLTGHDYKVTFAAPGKIGIPWDHDGDPATLDSILLMDDYKWTVTDNSTGKAVIKDAGIYDGIINSYNADGFKIGMTGVPYWQNGREILGYSWKGASNVWTFVGGYEWILGGNFFGSSLAPFDVVKSVEVVFDKSKKSKGYMYLRGGSPNYGYQGYFDSPITIWDISDPNNRKQICYAFVEQNGIPYNNKEWGPGNATGDREYIFIIDEPYSDTPNPKYTGTFKINAGAGDMPIPYAAWITTSGNPQASPTDYKWNDGDKFIITANTPFTSADVFQFKTVAPDSTKETALKDVEAVNVFPNPYFADNSQELNKYQRFVTFNHLPGKATIRVYSLAGTLVQQIDKTSDSQLATWDLRNSNGLPVGSGMYIIHIDMPDLGTTKVLKLAVIMEAQFLDRI